MDNMKLEDAEIWLEQVVKGGLADKETIKAVDTVLRAIKIKDGYLNAICSLLADTSDCETRKDLDELIIDAWHFAYKGLKNDGSAKGGKVK